MIIMNTEQQVIHQHRQWLDMETTHYRQAHECELLAQAALQGYANVKTQAAGVKVGAVYECDSHYGQVTGVYAKLDSNRDNRPRIDVYIETRGVDANGNPLGGGVCQLLEAWDATGYTCTDIQGAPIE
jgi:hypothetical protein